ncbi:MAG TPA: type II secretion system F family protein, partial [Methanocorpusculum sp.]|nr:type II secretion system F family protein [Methanocorpusculum sp.]
MRSKRRIDATLPDAVQYLYILHKSGANQYEAVKSLSENAAYFGDAAAEFSRVISDTELGIGIHEALKHLSLDTPSKKLRRFVAGYAASVRTTGDAVPYLEDMVSSMREEQRILQEKYLSSLGVFAEIYLTLFVAGPLFAVIAGMVLGIISSADTLGLSAIIYAVLPLGAVAYLILLD